MAFNGTWKVDRSENYDKFMEQMGISLMKRKLAAHDNLKITLDQSGEKFYVKEVSTFRTLELDFTLGVTFEYSLADGTQLSVCPFTPTYTAVTHTHTPAGGCSFNTIYGLE
ncbi:Fatty acid-binding protein, intestinal [Bagarius yarrelli]|uniref:Fatty acid-binding protein, intestinal n=1 Tax=Bagarius yarrelli TaxID=175774 RepID=A0A556VBK6_BAGYA|nr:Fatty acid-binding protein, intestinal [Bagarius yarrelli]